MSNQQKFGQKYHIASLLLCYLYCKFSRLRFDINNNNNLFIKTLDDGSFVTFLIRNTKNFNTLNNLKF